MSTKISKILAVIAGITILVLGIMAIARPDSVFAASSEGEENDVGRGRDGQGGGTSSRGNGLAPLSDAEKDALNQAILEEYGALNLYQAVTEKFGDVSPFVEIAVSEQRHADTLIRLATKYGMAVPANPGLAEPASFNTLDEACLAGVNAEIADADLYEQLKPVVTHTDILRVFSNLQRASLENHLPDFQDCP